MLDQETNYVDVTKSVIITKIAVMTSAPRIPKGDVDRELLGCVPLHFDEYQYANYFEREVPKDVV